MLSTAGCATDEDSADSNVVAFVTTTQQATTRATSRENMWNTTDRIAITDGTSVKKYMPKEAGASVALELDNSVTGASPFYWSIGKGNMTFEAWSPYTDTNDNQNVTVAADQRATSTDAIADEGTLSDATFNAYDLLYAPPQTVASGITVPLQFYHQMAHIVVYIIGVATEKVQVENQWIDLGEVEEVLSVVLGSENNPIYMNATDETPTYVDNKIAITGMLKRGVTGAAATEANKAQWAVGEQNSTIKMRDMDTQTTPGVGGKKKRRIFECIIPPQSGGVNPTYTSDGNNGYTIADKDHGTVLMTFYTTKRNDSPGSSPYKYEAAFDYKAGYEYIYYIGLERAGLYVDYVVKDWTLAINKEARSVFNYMDHPGVLITDWNASNVIATNLGKFE